MLRAKMLLNNETGLHARPASELSKIAMKYNECTITLKVDEKVIDAKSPLAIMAAGVKQNDEIEIICDGTNEENALNEIIKGFENNFEDIKKST